MQNKLRFIFCNNTKRKEINNFSVILQNILHFSLQISLKVVPLQSQNNK